MKRLVTALAIIALGVIAYARFIEPRHLVTREVPIRIRHPVEATAAAREIRILHLTDFHLSPEVSLDYIRGACERAAQQGPDIICLTGDFITDYLRQEEAYAGALRILSAAAPTFAIAGNHDGGIWARERGGYPNPGEVAALLRKGGVTYLANEMVETEARGVKLAIAGLGDLWAGNCRPEAVAEGLARSGADLRILMIHNPDAKSQVDGLTWDLLLAGHTHGGQFLLPWIGAPFAPVRDRSMVRGLFEWHGRKIHVSPGVGNLHGLRLFSPPEISVLRVTF